MLWLFDSRDRLHGGKRKLRILTHAVWAWEVVLNIEVPNEREDYHYLAENTDGTAEDADVFNDYWAEYGWYLMPVDDNAALPNDVEVVSDQA